MADIAIRVLDRKPRKKDFQFYSGNFNKLILLDFFNPKSAIKNPKSCLNGLFVQALLRWGFVKMSALSIGILLSFSSCTKYRQKINIPKNVPVFVEGRPLGCLDNDLMQAYGCPRSVLPVWDSLLRIWGQSSPAYLLAILAHLFIKWMAIFLYSPLLLFRILLTICIYRIVSEKAKLFWSAVRINQKVRRGNLWF